jgi:hypothetical protein
MRRIDSDDAWPSPRAFDIDAANSGVRVVATQEGHVQHSRQEDVVDEKRTSAEQARIFIAKDTSADETRHA